MPISNTKVIQAYIQGLVFVVRTIQAANTFGQALKAKYVAKNPSLVGTNITAAQITAVNNFLTNLDSLANGAVVTTLLSKDQPSHGTGALD